MHYFSHCDNMSKEEYDVSALLLSTCVVKNIAYLVVGSFPPFHLCSQEFENVEGEEYASEFSAQGSPATQNGPEVYILPLTEVSLPMSRQPGRSGKPVKLLCLFMCVLIYSSNSTSLHKPCKSHAHNDRQEFEKIAYQCSCTEKVAGRPPPIIMGTLL